MPDPHPGTEEQIKGTIREQFLRLKRPQDIAKLLGISYDALNFLVYAKQASAYNSFFIKKRKGGHRRIQAPSSALKTIQRRLADILNVIYERPSTVHGFVEDYGILSNARNHTEREWVLNLDLADFFPSINFGRVRGLFLKWPYSLPPAVATVLAQICCHENELPQGAPTSPIVSNLLCAKLDSNLKAIAKKHSCRYTRYADDITISTHQEKFPSAIAKYRRDRTIRLGKSLSTTIEANGFSVNSAKIRLQNCRQRQQVTGLTVNQSVNVPRAFIKQVRCMLHAWEKFTEEGAEKEFHARYNHKHRAPGKKLPPFRQVLHGKLRHLVHIRGSSNPVVVGLVQRARKLHSDFFKIPIWNDGIWIVTDEKISGRQGTAFLLRGYGVVSCWHVLAPESVLAHSDPHWSKTYRFDLHRGNRTLDLAILNATLEASYHFEPGDPDGVKVGDRVTLLGFPVWQRGQTVQTLQATVTGWQTRSATKRIMVDKPTISGMSGGPVLDSYGRVIGVTLTGTLGAAGGESVGNQVQPIKYLDQLLQFPPDQCHTEYDPIE